RDATRDATRNDLQQSRQNLQQARDTLQQALQAAGADRGQDMQQAAEQQKALQQRAEASAQQLQQAQQSGAITQQQAKAAGEQLQQAQQQMQQAQQLLQSGQQASAAGRQQQAAKDLQQAQAALQKNQQPTAAQQQALQQLAEEQQKLAEQIVALARELKDRNNKPAERALDDAAAAAERARQKLQQGDSEDAEDQQEQARQQLDRAAKALEEEKDRYQDLRQEEQLFRMKEELQTFLEKQQPITQQTLEAQAAAQKDRLSRPARLKLNQFGDQEQELAARLDFVHKALVEDGNLVFQTVLAANQDDLREVARRLAGRNPDPSSYTTMLQQDVEKRTVELLAALDRERQRREQERQQQQQQDQGQNKFNPQQQRLVSMIADLQMLKQLELDTRKAGADLKTLLELRGDEAITEAETALVERLSHRHGDITALFAQIKTQMEQALQQMQDGDDAGHDQSGTDKPKSGNGRGGKK
ncbi:MAG TPA: hypothetical protein VK348_03495, partial [Planctomycetota bacterium]|nr:hypothetical protein [Planctomycetota bacterium]